MKNIIKNNIFGYILGVISTLAIGAGASIIFQANEVNYTPEDTSWDVSDVEAALNDLYKGNSCLIDNALWEFVYTNGEQTFSVPYGGVYKLEVWGAQGGEHDSVHHGGYGAYAVGNIHLNTGDKLYINVGGSPTNSVSNAESRTGGYNGGGNSTVRNDCVNNAGGGATHIATKSGLLKTLSSSVSDILIVAGGGGGAGYHTEQRYGVGGSAGGISGSSGAFGANSNCEGYGLGGTQSAGGNYYILAGHAYEGSINIPLAGFGSGGAGDPNIGGSGGGGGFYGGRGTSCLGGGGGGSSYIGNEKLSNKTMYCYNCATSAIVSTHTVSVSCVNSTATVNCAKQGNGYVKITYIGKA